MWDSFEKLSKANVDHFNNHPAEHYIIIVVYAVVAGVVTNKFLKRIAGVNK